MEKTKEIIEKIREYTLEDIMGERFGSYSKYIIEGPLKRIRNYDFQIFFEIVYVYSKETFY